MIVKDETIDEVDEKNWDEFIKNSNNGTIFSTTRFYHHHDAPHDVHFIGCHDGIDQITGIAGSFADDAFVSPVGASYGGFIVPSTDFKTTEKGFLSVLDYFKTIGIRRIQITHPPLNYSIEINQNLDFIMRYYGFKEFQTLISSVTEVSNYDETSLSSVGKRAVRKAKKNRLQIKEIRDIDAFYEILRNNKAKFDLKPTHSKSEILKLLDLFPDHISIMGAFYEEKLIAGTLNMQCNSNTLLTFYIASDEAYQKYRPVNYLLHEVCLRAREEGIRYVDFGVSMETDTDNPMVPRRSLIHFKEHFNSKGFLRSRFSLEIS